MQWYKLLEEEFRKSVYQNMYGGVYELRDKFSDGQSRVAQGTSALSNMRRVVEEIREMQTLRKLYYWLVNHYLDSWRITQAQIALRRFVNGTLLNLPISAETGRVLPKWVIQPAPLKKEDLSFICSASKARERRTSSKEFFKVATPWDRIPYGELP